MIYAFEGIDDALDLVPYAARRALDVAGCKVSLESWRAMPLSSRKKVIASGAGARVREADLRKALDASRVKLTTMPPQGDPDPERLPSELDATLGATIGSSTWSSLTALDRYVLAKIAKKGDARKLALALNEIVIVPEPRNVSTHLSSKGEAHMVDVGAKPATLRRAVARARVTMQRETATRLRSGATPKGDVLAAARIAGIQASKRTPDLIPLCHVVALTRVEVSLHIDENGVGVEATAEALDRTGVEMEALVAASTAALTIYDMLKGIDRGMTIDLALIEKTGGKSGAWRRET